MSVSTSTRYASIPNTAAERTRASMSDDACPAHGSVTQSAHGRSSCCGPRALPSLRPRETGATRQPGRGEATLDCRMPQIGWEDFAKVDIRVGRIVQVDDFPKARKPAYQLRIDFGELGVKTSSAQITKYYDKADLVGKLVLAVVNFPPRQIANFFSEVLTLGVVLGGGG